MNYRKLIFGVLAIGLAIWLLLGLFRFGSVIAFFWIFPIIANELELAAGLNHFMAQIIAFVPSIVLLFAIGLMFSRRKEKRRLGMIIGGACYLLYCVLLFALEGNRYFDPSTGAATKCYAIGLADYEEMPCSWQFHPQTGNPVIKDPAQIKSIIRAKQMSDAELQKVARVQPTTDMRFFTPDGTPLFWYYQHPDGAIEIFGAPGKHPQLNVELNPINAEIVKQILIPDAATFRKIHVVETATPATPTNNTSPPARPPDPNNPLVKLRDHLQKVQDQLR